VRRVNTQPVKEMAMSAVRGSAVREKAGIMTDMAWLMKPSML
jgi:hypothetical protein